MDCKDIYCFLKCIKTEEIFCYYCMNVFLNEIHVLLKCFENFSGVWMLMLWCLDVNVMVSAGKCTIYAGLKLIW